MDAYSYICRGGVFANAETGNIVLFAINVASFQWIKALQYIIPITAFAIGVLISSIVKSKMEKTHIIHWRQITVLIESVLLGLVAFIPPSLNLVANSIISLVCGIQVAAFSKIHDNAVATTMCTGNLRSGTQNLYYYRLTKDKAFLKKGILYFGCIAWFVIGAVIGARIIAFYQLKSILVVSVGLWAVVLLMFSEQRVE